MLTTHSLVNERMVCHEATGPDLIDPCVLWIDLIKPDDEERNLVREVYGQEIPSLSSLMEIEASSRFFEDETGLHLRSYFLHEFPDGPRNVNVGFILANERLFTLREDKLPAFDDFVQQIGQRPGFICDAFSIVLGLFEIQVDRIADILEGLYVEQDRSGREAFGKEERDMEAVVTGVSDIEDMNSRARLSLMDKQRVLGFLLRSGKMPEDQEPRLGEILRDIDSLIIHSTFLSEKASFLMDITMGRINIEQNKIIKILSIAATVFLPPTLVASIYGMNFINMPELKWSLGYPLAIVLILASGAGPYYYFRHKKWL